MSSKKRVLFLPVSANPAVRNLFYYPDCAFQQLKAYAASHPDFFIVVLVYTREFKKFDTEEELINQIKKDIDLC